MESNSPDAPPVPQNGNTLPSHLDFPIIGIGASAGGLQAARALLQELPANCGMAVVVVLHLSPDHPSESVRLLQAVTSMPVLEVGKPVPIEKQRVYVISPGKQLTMNDGYLRIGPSEPHRGRHVTIDLFFRTLADAHKERAFCVVLSGAGSDGAVGLSRIKEQGGVTLVQAPDEAEYDGMPRAAIETGQVDLVLPVREIALKLVELRNNLASLTLPCVDPESELGLQVDSSPNGEAMRAAEHALHEVIGLLRSRTGYDFRRYKRATVLRRIERRMQVNGLADLPGYHAHLQANLAETSALLGDMLIGVTNFFRDRDAFEALERDVIPQLFGREADAEREIRVWSAACSTGEEAYSLAMLLCDQAEQDGRPTKLQVFATDIDERAVATGRSGVYPEAIVTDVPPARLRQFFTREQTHYRIKKAVRETVLFAQHSLLRDPPFSKLDLICCRNLLIYLSREVQQDILRMFHFALRPGGYLFLGSSESADACSDLFTPVDKKHRIYRAEIGPQGGRYTPLPAVAGFQRAALPIKQRPEPRKVALTEVHRRALEQYAPPSLIVNHDSDIMHSSDSAGRFLQHVGGEPSRNLLTLVHPDLRAEMRSLLFQAMHTRKHAEARRVRFSRDGQASLVNLEARPFADEQSGNDYVLVLFDEQDVDVLALPDEPQDLAQDSVLQRLEDELRSTKEQLQNTIEQSETSTEELKASNEELQAINEELRSTTEELETSKEELQSINEELITVNHELKTKVEETGKINDDLQNLIASTEIATLFVDRGLRIKRYTPRVADIFNVIPSDVGRPLLDISHRLDYDELARDVTQVFESLRPIAREVHDSDGNWYIVRLLPYRTTEDRIEGAVLTFIDISARRQAQEQLRSGEELMRLVAESTRDYAIITLDTEGLVTSWNKGAVIIFGFEEAEALGKPADIIFVPEDREAGVPQREMAKARDTGRAEDERWHQRKDGSRFYCSGVMTPLLSANLRGYVKIARDLTDFRNQQMQQESRFNESRNSSQLKDEFFAIMSHELKHPLNLIQLHAELLSRRPETAASSVLTRSAHTIRQAVRSQARIIDDLLDLSRVRTGKLKLNRMPLDFRALIEEIAEVARVEALSRRIDLRIEQRCDQERLIIEADSTRIEQIIWNLMNNALKFTPDGGNVTLIAEPEQGMARLRVIDDGQGIEAEFLPKVFDLFNQADGRHAQRNRDGMGIGLSLVRQLAEAHGGRVDVSSPGPEQGSTFSVWLPLHTLPHAQPIPSKAVEAGQLKDLRILLVDDSPDILETLQLLLEMEDAQVISATSGEDALRLANTHTFDLILSDIGMPNMDGHALIRALRQLPQCASVPAIALTGYGTSEDARKTLDAGFNQHIGKPVAYDALIATIEKLLH